MNNNQTSMSGASWAQNPILAATNWGQKKVANSNLNAKQHNMALDRMAAQAALGYHFGSMLQAEGHQQNMERDAQSQKHDRSMLRMGNLHDKDMAGVNHANQMAINDQVHGHMTAQAEQAFGHRTAEAGQQNAHEVLLANTQNDHAMAMAQAQHGFNMASAAQSHVNQVALNQQAHDHNTAVIGMNQAHEINKMRQEGTTTRANMKAAVGHVQELGKTGMVSSFEVNKGGAVSAKFNPPAKAPAARKPAAKKAAAGPKTPPAARRTK